MIPQEDVDRIQAEIDISHAAYIQRERLDHVLDALGELYTALKFRRHLGWESEIARLMEAYERWLGIS